MTVPVINATINFSTGPSTAQAMQLDIGVLGTNVLADAVAVIVDVSDRINFIQTAVGRNALFDQFQTGQLTLRIVDQKMHRYFPDFIVKVREKTGLVMTYILEVKPEKQTKVPIQKRKTQKYLQEAATYAINQEKWRAADIFCQEHGWKFRVVTEKSNLRKYYGRNTSNEFGRCGQCYLGNVSP